MRNILLTLSVVLLCIGCQKDDVDTGFKVSTKRVTLSHEAGEFTIEFNNSQYMTDTPDILIDYGGCRKDTAQSNVQISEQ